LFTTYSERSVPPGSELVTRPTSMGYTPSPARWRQTRSVSMGIPNCRKNSFSVPAATTPRRGLATMARPFSNIPLTTSCTRGSPPTATRNRSPESRQARAHLAPSPGPSATTTRCSRPRAPRARSTRGRESTTSDSAIRTIGPNGLVTNEDGRRLQTGVGDHSVVHGLPGLGREARGGLRRHVLDLVEEVHQELAV